MSQLVAGGVGITPLFSILAEVHARLHRKGAEDPQLAQLREVGLFVLDRALSDVLRLGAPDLGLS